MSICSDEIWKIVLFWFEKINIQLTENDVKKDFKKIERLATFVRVLYNSVTALTR